MIDENERKVLERKDRLMQFDLQVSKQRPHMNEGYRFFNAFRHASLETTQLVYPKTFLDFYHSVSR